MRLHTFFIIALIGLSIQAKGQPFRFSDGLYRLPYLDGYKISVHHDVNDHAPPGCFDIAGTEGGPYFIVAAADGWIRDIVDVNYESCWCCNNKNNYIILEHPNGEWSTYIHLAQGTIRAQGHRRDDWVTAGTILGIEGSVGCSTGPHLHFEVARPHNSNDLTPWDTGGMLRGKGETVNPIFCNTPSGTITKGNTYTAGPCSDNCPTNITTSVTLSNDVIRADNTITSTATFLTNATGTYRAGRAIELKPGFRALSGSRLNMLIRSCNER